MHHLFFLNCFILRISIFSIFLLLQLMISSIDICIFNLQNHVIYLDERSLFTSTNLRWLDTVLKMENSRFRSVFLDNYYLLKNKKYVYSCKTKSKGFEFFHKSHATAVAMATMTFQYGRYSGFKVI